MFKDWLKNDEMTRVNGGIKSPTAYPGFAEYLVNTPAGQRNFVIMFSKTNDALHINLLGAGRNGMDIDPNVNALPILQKFAQELCQKFGSVDPAKISYTPSAGQIRQASGERAQAVRERLFQRYIKILQQNMPASCKLQQTQPQKGRFDDHPMRSIYRGTDDEFASVFGLGK